MPFADVVIIRTTLLSCLCYLYFIQATLYHFSFIFVFVKMTHTYACDKRLKSAHHFVMLVVRELDYATLMKTMLLADSNTVEWKRNADHMLM